jgi:TRAP-type transport system small permease protein
VSEPSTEQRAQPGRWERVLGAVGAVALLTMMATDALAVIGRHAGFAVIGAIEVFQVCAVIATSAAVIIATLGERHAAVHVLTEYVAPATRALLDRVGRLAGALSFVLLCGGSAWVLADLWGTREMTELLGIPLRWFRLAWIIAAGAVATIFIVRAFRRSPAHG